MNSKSCLIMGLPNTGKTTYIGALFYCLDHDADYELSLPEYTGDHSYIANLGQKWAEFRQMDRTTPALEEKKIELKLVNKKGDVIRTMFPDLSGESFQNLYIEREISPELYEFIKDCSGVLLFINANEINDPKFLCDLPKDYRENLQNEKEPILSRDALEDPDEVKIVDLMQFVSFIRKDEIIKICVIVSAWDVVEGDYELAETFIEERLPLLSQFLLANEDIFVTKYYGVSAQGGDLELDSERLENYENPAERIKVVYGKNLITNDITLPLSEIVGEL